MTLILVKVFWDRETSASVGRPGRDLNQLLTSSRSKSTKESTNERVGGVDATQFCLIQTMGRGKTTKWKNFHPYEAGLFGEGSIDEDERSAPRTQDRSKRQPHQPRRSNLPRSVGTIRVGHDKFGTLHHVCLPWACVKDGLTSR